MGMPSLSTSGLRRMQKLYSQGSMSLIICLLSDTLERSSRQHRLCVHNSHGRHVRGPLLWSMICWQSPLRQRGVHDTYAQTTMAESKVCRKLHLKGAAANSVGLVLILLMASTQRQLVNEVQRARHLALPHSAGIPVLLIGLPDAPNVVLRPHPHVRREALCEPHTYRTHGRHAAQARQLAPIRYSAHAVWRSHIVLAYWSSS